MNDSLRYRDLLLYLVGRKLKVRYRRSSIGFGWSMPIASRSQSL